MQRSPAPAGPSFFARAALVASFTIAKVRRTRILGVTPQAIYRDLAIQRASRYSPNDQYDFVPSLPVEAGSEGDVSIQKSRRTGYLIVIKHTHPRHSAPTDANFAKNVLKPHPNIVVVHNFFTDPDSPDRYYIHMAACTGGDLMDQILYWHHRRQRSTPQLFIYHAVVQILDIMAYIHHGLRHSSEGFYTQDADHRCVIHGDLKPEQFFLDWSECTGGMPKLVLGDFGQARLMNQPASESGLGTPGWYAPEQLDMIEAGHPESEICKARTPACDVYTTGLILYIIATEHTEGVGEEWPTGQDEETLRLSREHGLRDIVYSCLRVDAEKRASASFNKHDGILELTNGMRKVRDSMISTGRGTAEISDPTDWARAALAGLDR